MKQIHASCVAIDEAAVLLRGAPGSGKSDLALRLIEAGAVLVADDYVRLRQIDGALWAQPPESIQGRIEARGIGVLRLPFSTSARVCLVVDLIPRQAVERLPEPDSERFAGVVIRRLALHAFDQATMAKIKLVLATDD